MGDENRASWNRIARWLGRMEALRAAALNKTIQPQHGHRSALPPASRVPPNPPFLSDNFWHDAAVLSLRL